MLVYEEALQSNILSGMQAWLTVFLLASAIARHAPVSYVHHRHLEERSIQVFVDAKYLDIPRTLSFLVSPAITQKELVDEIEGLLHANNPRIKGTILGSGKGRLRIKGSNACVRVSWLTIHVYFHSLRNLVQR